MASEDLTVLRDCLTNFVDASDGAALPREMVAEFRRAHAREIEAATRDLQDLALVKLLSDVSRRRKATGDPRQGDLFPSGNVPHAIVVPMLLGGRMRQVRKPFLSLTLREAEAYLDRKPRTRAPKPDAGVVAVLDMIRHHMTSPDQTIADGLAAAHAAELAEGSAHQALEA